MNTMVTVLEGIAALATPIGAVAAALASALAAWHGWRARQEIAVNHSELKAMNCSD